MPVSWVGPDPWRVVPASSRRRRQWRQGMTMAAKYARAPPRAAGAATDEVDACSRRRTSGSGYVAAMATGATPEPPCARPAAAAAHSMLRSASRFGLRSGARAPGEPARLRDDPGYPTGPRTACARRPAQRGWATAPDSAALHPACAVHGRRCRPTSPLRRPGTLDPRAARAAVVHCPRGRRRGHQSPSPAAPSTGARHPRPETPTCPATPATTSFSSR